MTPNEHERRPLEGGPQAPATEREERAGWAAADALREPPRLLYLIAAVAIAVAVVGYLTGVRHPGPPHGHGGEDGAGATVASNAMPTYRDIGESRRGVHAEMYDEAFDQLHTGLPSPVEPVDRAGDADAVRAARALRRAYDGAPPTIPHHVDQLDYPACLACHERGARIGGRVAPIISHERFDNCYQCHVAEDNPVRLGDALRTENAFVGLAPPTQGSRAWTGAPPTIPHTTWMRSNCDSCHGVTGPSPIRSTHPWRLQCRQCHVPDVGRDRSFFPPAYAPIHAPGDAPPPPRRPAPPSPP